MDKTRAAQPLKAWSNPDFTIYGSVQRITQAEPIRKEFGVGDSIVYTDPNTGNDVVVPIPGQALS